jgi:DNA (cytosine-5)-methyltransferase 1
MGLASAGFKNNAAIEWNQDACNTLRANQARGTKPISDWTIVQGDVRTFDYSPFVGKTDVVAGGPPCQPFSLGGKHRGYQDSRDMWPEAVRAVRELRPKAFVFENVPGLLRNAFARYFEYLQLQLQYPDVAPRGGEEWTTHLARLEQHHTAGEANRADYRLVYALLNAADYGTAQARERVVIVGTRADLDVSFSFPEPTHSEAALLRDQWATGEYWDRHKVSKRARPEPTDAARRKAARKELFDGLQPWRTVRDAIADLPDPELKPDAAAAIPNHVFNPGARTYPGHTGSPVDRPAKTLTAGDHGVPGGENMVVFPDGRLRYFTVRESARLQSFPDDFVLTGSWTEAMRQLGNAVPVTLAEVVGKTLRAKLRRSPRRSLAISQAR